MLELICRKTCSTCRKAVILLEERGIAYRYREYTDDPLTRSELEVLFARLGARPADLLRKRDRAYGELGLSGEENDDELIAAMAEHPTLLQRPIGVVGERAVVGRPPEDLLGLVDA